MVKTIALIGKNFVLAIVFYVSFYYNTSHKDKRLRESVEFKLQEITKWKNSNYIQLALLLLGVGV